MKNFRHGQAAIITDAQYERIFKQLANPQHRLILAIARYSGERWGAILQLSVSDCYSDPARSLPHKVLTFRAATRKRDCQGRSRTRQIDMHENLMRAFGSYTPPLTGFLFPSPAGDRPVSFKAADAWFRRAVARAGLGDRGISTHSTRRTAITKLNRAGISIPVIKEFSGHRSLEALQRYIEVEPEQLSRAIAVL